MSGSPSPPVLTVLQRIQSGSNAVYRCVDTEGDGWVYKPAAGERPLADFPDGTLAGREVAAYVVSAALGWDVVPETVAVTGPGGPGMAQRWVVEADRSDDPSSSDPVDIHPVGAVPADRVAVLRGEGSDGADVVVAHALDARIRRVALFDHVINNADRKGGHLLLDTSGVIWAIDHGLSFHTEPKVRTVLWGWAGQSLPEQDLEGLGRVRGELRAGGILTLALADLLSPGETAALEARVVALVEGRVFPIPGPGYPLPWPLF